MKKNKFSMVINKTMISKITIKDVTPEHPRLIGLPRACPLDM